MPDAFDTGPGPGRAAFVWAYVGVVAAGLIGALIGSGWARIACRQDCTSSVAVGAIVGGIATAFGAGVIAVVALRAMAEWRRPS